MTPLSPEKGVTPSAPSSYGSGDFCWGIYTLCRQSLCHMDPDKNPGFCEAYDIVEYPTIIAIDHDGSIRAVWRGRNLPLLDDVTFYMI